MSQEVFCHRVEQQHEHVEQQAPCNASLRQPSATPASQGWEVTRESDNQPATLILLSGQSCRATGPHQAQLPERPQTDAAAAAFL